MFILHVNGSKEPSLSNLIITSENSDNDLKYNLSSQSLDFEHDSSTTQSQESSITYQRQPKETNLPCQALIENSRMIQRRQFFYEDPHFAEMLQILPLFCVKQFEFSLYYEEAGCLSSSINDKYKVEQDILELFLFFKERVFINNEQIRLEGIKYSRKQLNFV